MPPNSLPFSLSLSLIPSTWLWRFETWVLFHWTWVREERGEQIQGARGAPFPLLSPPPFPVPVKEERWDFLGPFAKKDATAAAAAVIAGAFVAAAVVCSWRRNAFPPLEGHGALGYVVYSLLCLHTLCLGLYSYCMHVEEGRGKSQILTVAKRQK